MKKKSGIVQDFEYYNFKLKAIHRCVLKTSLDVNKAFEMVLELGLSVDIKRIMIKPLGTISEEQLM